MTLKIFVVLVAWWALDRMWQGVFDAVSEGMDF